MELDKTSEAFKKGAYYDGRNKSYSAEIGEINESIDDVKTILKSGEASLNNLIGVINDNINIANAEIGKYNSYIGNANR